MIVWDREKLAGEGYKINDRKPLSIEPIWRHAEKFRLPLPNFRGEEIIYSGAEHVGKPKKVNVTYLPNIINYPHGVLMGSTFGHKHNQSLKGDRRPFQEIYEFESYGGVLLRKEKSAKLLLARPGEKIIIGTDENMTLFNFGDEPLMTFDYANPEMNSATKELEGNIGPLMAVWKTNYDLTFRINPNYREKGLIEGFRDTITLRTPKREEALYLETRAQRGLFSEAGIEIAFGENIPDRFKEEFSGKTLIQLVEEKNQTLFEALDLQ